MTNQANTEVEKSKEKSKTSNLEIIADSIKNITYVDGSLRVAGDDNPNYVPDITFIDPTNPIYKGERRRFDITMDCPRKGNDIVANKYNDETGGAHHISSYHMSKDNEPGSLNFSFDIELEFIDTTLVNEQLSVAQGHYSGNNNWWAGGKVCDYDYDNKLYLMKDGSDPTKGGKKLLWLNWYNNSEIELVDTTSK